MIIGGRFFMGAKMLEFQYVGCVRAESGAFLWLKVENCSLLV